VLLIKFYFDFIYSLNFYNKYDFIIKKNLYDLKLFKIIIINISLNYLITFMQKVKFMY